MREPLVHFLVLGAGLFLLNGYVGTDNSDPIDQIVVDAIEIERLASQFQRTWMRPPTHQELQGLAKEFVKEEILYREALALGLDKGDLVVRRRMRQKLEFLNADLVEQRSPTDSELRNYLDADSEKFRTPSRYSFRQIYLNPETSGADGKQRAAELLARIQEHHDLAADPRITGDPTLLPPTLELASKQEISAVFGNLLADSVSGAEKGAWRGPYPSSYGLHLIYLSEVTEGGLPEFEKIRPAVEREWANDRRQQANEQFYQALRERYAIEFRLPEDTAAGGDSAATAR